VTQLLPAPPGFNARKDALSRTYRYFLQVGGVDSPFHARYSWRVGPGLDVTALKKTAASVAGRHDFTAFTPAETEHIFFHRNVLRCRWLRCGPEHYALVIEADAFLRHMVRTLVGTMVEIGMGERAPADLARLLEGASREEAGITAPARGLFLWDIKYVDSAQAHQDTT
jgi:tRNA pseudouridine38-40 synthase